MNMDIITLQKDTVLLLLIFLSVLEKKFLVGMINQVLDGKFVGFHLAGM